MLARLALDSNGPERKERLGQRPRALAREAHEERLPVEGRSRVDLVRGDVVVPEDTAEVRELCLRERLAPHLALLGFRLGGSRRVEADARECARDAGGEARERQEL